MKKSMLKNLGLVVILATAAMILSACGATTPAEPTTDPNVIFTQVAETVMVSMTQTAESLPPTATPEPTATTAPTQPVVPTVDISAQSGDGAQQPGAVATATTALFPTATTQLLGDVAQWNTQSPVDGKVFTAYEEFTFHVCMSNVGTHDWTTDYYLGYLDGNKACYDNTTKVGEITESGEKWCFDLSCQAPGSSGTYTTYWFLYDENGNKVTNGEVYFTYKVE
jgi:hypothetical protein